MNSNTRRENLYRKIQILYKNEEFKRENEDQNQGPRHMTKPLDLVLWL